MISGRSCAIQNTVSHYSPVIIAPFVDKFIAPASRKKMVAALPARVGVRGKDFFPYKPRHLASAPPRPALARVTNIAQRVMASGKYDGAIVTQGSPGRWRKPPIGPIF
jgi:hypothetical protein